MANAIIQANPAPLPVFADAACRYAAPEIFFPVSGPPRIAEARDICARCPVRDACYEHALHHEEYGVWAGTTPRDRKRLRVALGIRFQPFVDAADLLGLVGRQVS